MAMEDRCDDGKGKVAQKVADAPGGVIISRTGGLAVKVAP
jgi:hypothetical protein